MRTLLSILIISIVAGLFSMKFDLLPLDLSRGALHSVREWEELKLGDKELSIKLKTRWRDGRLYFKVALYPHSSLEPIYDKMENNLEYRKLKQYFTIKFFDEYGFLVKRLQLDINQFTDIIGEDKKPYQAEINDSIACTRNDYLAIRTRRIAWALDYDALPNSAK